MQMFFSPSTVGFYCEEVHGDKMPADAIAISDELYAATRGRHVVPDAQGMPSVYVAPPPSVATLVADLTTSLQALMDARAQVIGYDDLKTAITYRGDPNPKFAAEAEALFIWRSAVWTTAYAILADVQAGTRALPTPVEAVALMPALNLPLHSEA